MLGDASVPVLETDTEALTAVLTAYKWKMKNFLTDSEGRQGRQFF